MPQEQITQTDEPDIMERRRQSLVRMLFRRCKDSEWLRERTSLMLSYLDFAYDRAVSDSVRFRALERFADMLDHGTGAGAGEPPGPLSGELGALLEQSVARAEDVAAPVLNAILYMAQSREVSDSVRLRALERILVKLDRRDDHGAEQDQPLPEEWQRALRQFEHDLRHGGADAPAPGAGPGGAAAGSGLALG